MADKQQEEILRSGAAAWNKWRDENPQEAIDLTSAEIEGLDLQEVNLAHADLSKIRLVKCQFNRGDFKGSNLEKSTIYNCDFSNADFSGANISRMRQINGKFANANFSQVCASGAKLDCAGFTNANFTDAKLEGASFLQSWLDNTDFTNANISGVDFTEARILKSMFFNSLFNSNSFYRTIISNTSLKYIDSNSIFSNSPYAAFFHTELKEIDFSGMKLMNVKFYNTFLSDANFSNADIESAQFQDAILTGANFSGANLRFVTFISSTPYNLEGVNFSNACLKNVQLRGVNLKNAILKKADLTEINLTNADLSNADLSESSLEYAILNKANVEGANFEGSSVYGLSTWSLRGTSANQKNLVVKDSTGFTVTVSDIYVAQFIHMLTERKRLSNVIEALTTKAVLILGRFSSERKLILDTVAAQLQLNDYLPVIFDFEGPTTRNTIETVKILAGLSLFVIADVTSPKSAPLELGSFVPDFNIPVVSIIDKDERPFSMLQDLKVMYPTIVEHTFSYSSVDDIIKCFQKIITAAKLKHDEMEHNKKIRVSFLLK